MKIIGVDNYAREDVSDQLVCENVNSYYGKLLVNFLNEQLCETDGYYYKLVEDDYKLYVFRP